MKTCAVFAIVLALIVALAWGLDESFSDEDVQCDFNGTSGEMKLQYQQRRGTPMQCKLSWTRLQERSVASGGGGGSDPDFDIIPDDTANGLQFKWRAGTSGQYSHDGEAHFSYNGQERVMEVYAHVGSEDKTISVWPGRSTVARRHQLKWSFRFRVNDSESSNNWSWLYGTNGELCVGATLACHQSESECAQERRGMQAGTPRSCQAESPVSIGGRGQLVSSQYVYVDGAEQVMNQTRLQYRQRAEHTYSFAWCFPHFTTELTYDPTLTLAEINSSPNLALVVGLSVGGAFVALLAIGGLVCCMRRRGKAAPAAAAASVAQHA
jgi:hypothetical protein